MVDQKFLFRNNEDPVPISFLAGPPFPSAPVGCKLLSPSDVPSLKILGHCKGHDDENDGGENGQAEAERHASRTIA